MQNEPPVTAGPSALGTAPYGALTDSDKEHILALQQAILEATTRGDAPLEIINRVCQLEEQLVPNAVASVMLLDEQRQSLDVYAAPSIPPAGIARLNGLRPGPGAGSCGNVLFRQEAVFVSDTSADPRWDDLRQLAIDFDLMACWSVPIRSNGGSIVGTFALSSFERRAPTAFHRALLDIGASIIGIVLSRSKEADSLRLLAQIFESSREGILITDQALRIVAVNPALARSTGCGEAQLVGKTLAFLSSAREADFSQAMRDSLDRQGHWQHEVWNRRANGEEFPALLSVSEVRDRDGQVTHYVGFHFDISERKAAEEKIAFLAYHDALTGLPNRMLARERLHLAIALAARAGHRVALLFFDLDNFKMINDSLGHTTGDGLLQAVAVRLRGCTREGDTLSRLGGDEFLLILSDVAGPDDIGHVSEKILAQLTEPFHVEGNELTTSVSIGVAVYPEDGQDFETLLKKADTAMYSAKEAGRNTYRFYTRQMNVDALEHLKIRTGLRQALDQGQFVLHFQPQVDLATGRTVGAEALIRWAHPELGLLPPARFISIAEDSGLIVPIGDWVLREACRQAAAWRSASGVSDLVCAVNLSAPQFRRGDLEGSVARALADSGLDPACLELELTESILIQDIDHVLATVQRLKSLGVKLSIDDFGTGYSSLSYLKRFAVDKLKIDRSFVRGMADDPNDAAIVRAIIQMARSLGLKTIAEGVEDDRLRALLLAHRCDEGQGFHFARPLPAEELLRYALRVHAAAQI
jgi:diguanylate cyclase (GGDEF)-like protein/PAS domain S-box-containing protein